MACAARQQLANEAAGEAAAEGHRKTQDLSAFNQGQPLQPAAKPHEVKAHVAVLRLPRRGGMTRIKLCADSAAVIRKTQDGMHCEACVVGTAASR